MFQVTNPDGSRQDERPVQWDDVFESPDDHMRMLKVPHLSEEYPQEKTFESPLKVWQNSKGFLDDGSMITSALSQWGNGGPGGGREFTCCLRAGPREHLYWDPKTVKAAIVNCGGLCPGLNSVIREVVMMLWTYGVREIYGIIGGYKGVMEPQNWQRLTPSVVQKIHTRGGSFLVSDRGNPPHIEMAKMYKSKGINNVYIIGGDGTHKGAMQTYEQMVLMNYRCSITGIPKTIDNDIAVLDYTFGFHTAVAEATKAIDTAYTESAGNANCLGVVKLMGRHAGFIAVQASLASRHVDLCLIPEMEVDMDKMLNYLVDVQQKKKNAVVVIAEGLGDTLIKGEGVDAGGNSKLADVGPWFKDQVEAAFKKRGVPLSVKFIDPSYMIRAAAPDSFDSVYCSILAQNAVHGSMAGHTGFSSVMIDHHYVMVPIYMITDRKSKRVDIYGQEFGKLLWTTKQPSLTAASLPQTPAALGAKRKKTFEAMNVMEKKPDYMSDPLPMKFFLRQKDKVRRCLLKRYTRNLGDELPNSLPLQEHGLEVFKSDCSWSSACCWIDRGQEGNKSGEYLQLLRAGPREHMYWQPDQVKAVIINAGSLCPGLNLVIREIVGMLDIYGCQEIYGVLGGFNGVTNPSKWRCLTPEVVEEIHLEGGSWLVADRGNPAHSQMALTLRAEGVNQVFIIGGSGTHQGAAQIMDECDKIGYKCSIGGVLNSIDNDLPIIDFSFGFQSAVSKAQEAIDSAYTESRSSPNCLGLVKLMGRHSGFVPLRAVLAARHVDLCLIPEMDIDMPKVLNYLQSCVTRGTLDVTHGPKAMEAMVGGSAGMGAVCVIAEGVGDAIAQRAEAMGRPYSFSERRRMSTDVGKWFQEQIEAHMAEKGINFQCKYIDPSFTIRSALPDPVDGVKCASLAYQVVHGCMAGYSDFTVGQVDNHMVMIPNHEVANRGRRTCNPSGRWFGRLLNSTKQPAMAIEGEAGRAKIPLAPGLGQKGAILSVAAREILDSRGSPTVEVDLWTNEGQFRASVPSGASTGIYEALELRDGDPKRAMGKGVLKAVQNVMQIIAPKIIGMDTRQQVDIDNLMVQQLDGSRNEWGWSKAKLGANAILAVSMAVCRAGAAANGMRLFQHVAVLAGKPTEDFVLPVPSFNVINGGTHAGNRLAVQEFMILPVGAASFREAMNIGAEVYHTLKGVLNKKYGQDACNVGDEGGFAPPVQDNSEALDVLMEAVEKSGHASKIKLGTDVAASEFYVKDSKSYDLDFKNPAGSGPGMKKSVDELIDVYSGWLKKYPLISIEDPFDQDDFDAYTKLQAKVGAETQIVGDDLLVTNPVRVTLARDKKMCNALLLKINQIGSITEAIEATKIAQGAGWGVMVSHRSGETEDSFIADLVVGLRAGQIKTGAPCRSERLVKYNQLLRIEEELLEANMCTFAGTSFRRP